MGLVATILCKHWVPRFADYKCMCTVEVRSLEGWPPESVVISNECFVSSEQILLFR